MLDFYKPNIDNHTSQWFSGIIKPYTCLHSHTHRFLIYFIKTDSKAPQRESRVKLSSSKCGMRTQKSGGLK